MNIIHRISVSSTLEIQAELAQMGVAVASDGLVGFDVDESDPAWTSIQEWTKRRCALDIVRTTFSQGEIADARWLELVPDWQHGYPQPSEGTSGYRGVTYDLSDYCPHCGIGLRQRAPFRMKGEPKWGQRGLLQLNWVFDEFFVTPHVWRKVFAPMNVGNITVLDTHGDELSSVLQLDIRDEVEVDTGNLQSTTCAECDRIKYLPQTRGRFPRLATVPYASAVKTNQYFGSGAAAHKRVLVAGQLSQRLRAERVKGASFRPVVE